MSAPGPSSNTAHIGSRASLLKRDRTISRLAALHYRVFNKNEFRHRPQEARESLDAIASELGPFDSLPPKAQRLREDLLAFTEGLEAGDNANNRGASVALAATERPPQYPTAAEIVEEVVRRLNQDVPWASEAPTTPDHDVRDIPTFYNHMVEERHDGLWPRENYTPEVQDDYRAPWHADRNHGLGINANESPFAEIFNQDIELPKKSSGTCVFWKNMGRPFERESPHDKSFIGSRSALVERWRVEAESGKPLDIIVKRASYSAWDRDYCSEASYTLRLNGAGCKNVIKVLDWYSYPNEDTFRICYEVAEHQDLFNIVEWYRYNSLVLPESFIWHTFHSLANAFLYCYNGRAESSRAIGWEEMVYADLKLDNVFIGTPDDEVHKLYPSVKLGDFGTRGWRAPELAKQARARARAEGRTQSPGPCEDKLVDEYPSELGTSTGSYSDIYALGLVIANMMEESCKDIIENPEYLETLHQQGIKRPYYSKVLVGLVEKCMEMDHTRRVDPHELYEVTRHYASEHQKLAYEAMRTATQNEEHSYSQRVIFSRVERVQYDSGKEYRQANPNGRDPRSDLYDAYLAINVRSRDDLESYLKRENNDVSKLSPNERLVSRLDNDIMDIIEEAGTWRGSSNESVGHEDELHAGQDEQSNEAESSGATPNQTTRPSNSQQHPTSQSSTQSSLTSLSSTSTQSSDHDGNNSDYSPDTSRNTRWIDEEPTGIELHERQTRRNARPAKIVALQNIADMHQDRLDREERILSRSKRRRTSDSTDGESEDESSSERPSTRGKRNAKRQKLNNAKTTRTANKGAASRGGAARGQAVKRRAAKGQAAKGRAAKGRAAKGADT